jgi:acyl-CoA dehydrogenase family protein 9
LAGTNRAWESLYDAMQVAGGSGYLSSQPYEKRMRDFRVTTIFEGTTEIHSIYPPLSLSREIYKQLKGGSEIGKFLAIAAAKARPSRWKMRSKIGAIRRAGREAKRDARLYRRLFIGAMLKFGARLPMQELLLRRLTTISVHVFGLLAMIAKLRYCMDRGEDIRDLSRVLDWLIEDARVECRKNYRLGPDRAERKERSIFALVERNGAP